MKKYFNYGVMVIMMALLCVGSSSCSKDDDEGNGSNAKYEIYVDGELLPVDPDDYVLSRGHYVVPYESFEFTIKFKAYYSDFPLIYFGFSIPKVDLIKVGDDITKYEDFSIMLGSMIETKYNSGAVTVTKHDLKNKILSFEFKDVAVTNRNITTSQKTNHVITGKVTLSYDVD